MISLPYNLSSRVWDPSQPTTHYLSTGEIIQAEDDRAMVVPQRHFHLNDVPVGKALHLSLETDRTANWSYTLTNAQGHQRAYHGTPLEAANPPGAAHIEGVVSLAVWCGQPGVARKPQKPRAAPAINSPVRKAAIHVRKAAELVATRTLTQEDSDTRPAMRRRKVLGILRHSATSIAALDSLDGHAPPRTDLDVGWEVLRDD